MSGTRIVLDGSAMVTREAAHAHIAAQMAFPAWYGANLDALWDMLTTLPEDTEVTLLHASALKTALGGYGQSLLDTFAEAAQEQPRLHFTALEGGREKPCLTPESTRTVFETRYIKVYDMQTGPGRHYYNASRRGHDELAALKTDEQFKAMLPDAVTCVTVLAPEGAEPRLLLSREYRYPVGQFLLSPCAGLIDPADAATPSPLCAAAVRELHEEAGITVTGEDTVFELTHCLFSSPGMTDESNGIVCAVIRHKGALNELNQNGAEATEVFDGFTLLTAAQAQAILRRGTDDEGNFIPVYTWTALSCFVSGLWKPE